MTRTSTTGTILALLLVPAIAGAQAAPFEARVDPLFARWDSRESPGCAVAASRDGREILARAYGMADLERDVPNTPETVFEAGSVSKQFTAAAVALLAQQGKLSLDDDVRKHVPELPGYGTPITIRHLFSHTSGLRDWGTVAVATGWPRTTRVNTHDHVLDIITRQKSLNYTPGAEYSYTNSGYSLLAIIAERVSGESLDDFSRRNFFEPLGMKSTQWRDDHTRIVKRRAIAYRAGEDRRFELLMPFENAYGNGGLLTTVGDLLRWTDALQQGTVAGGKALVDELQRQAVLTDGRKLTYAGGLVVSRYKGVPQVAHSGSTAGYRAFLTRFPEQRVAVAVLCNVTNGAAESLAHGTADVVLGDVLRPAAPPTAVSVAPERLERLAGLYRNLRTQDPTRVEVRDGKLRVDGRGALVPLSETTFAVEGSAGPGRVVFDLPASGRPTAMRVTADDGDVVAFEPVAVATPTAEQLRAYAGRYESDEAEVSYEVAVADGKLELRRRPGVVMALTPAYADAFTTEDGMLVRFTRAGGAVDQMSFGMGRVRDLRFARVPASR